MVPEWLGWTDVVLSVVAFGIGLMTLPTAFKMWWGKPTPDMRFATDRRESGVGLKCFITNDQVNSPLKKASLTGFHATAKHIAAKAGFAILGDDEDDLNDQDGSSGRNKHEQGANSARHGLLRGAGADELAHQQR